MTNNIMQQQALYYAAASSTSPHSHSPLVYSPTGNTGDGIFAVPVPVGQMGQIGGQMGQQVYFQGNSNNNMGDTRENTATATSSTH